MAGFEHRGSEWQTGESEQTKYECTACDEENIRILHTKDELEETRKKKIQCWVQYKVYIQVPDQKFLQDGFMLIKVPIENKSVKLDLLQESFKTLIHAMLRMILQSFKHSIGNGNKPLDMHIKTVFLQSKQLNQLVYLDLPKEDNVPPDYIWKLLKSVYGLIDAF